MQILNVNVRFKQLPWLTRLMRIQNLKWIMRNLKTQKITQVLAGYEVHTSFTMSWDVEATSSKFTVEMNATYAGARELESIKEKE